MLFLTREYLMRHAAEEITEERFPETLELNGVLYGLSYRFEPGHALDGVTMTVPLHLLNQVDERRCEWLVPGLLREKVTHLIRELPKNLRKHFVPVPQVVTPALEHLEPGSSPLTVALSQALLRVTGVDVPQDAWNLAELPPFLHMNFKVVDEHGNELAMGRDIVELRAQLGVKARRQFSESAANQFERKGPDRLRSRRAARTGRVHARRAEADRLSGAGGRRQVGAPHAAGHRARCRSLPPTVACGACSSWPRRTQVKFVGAQSAGVPGHGAALCACCWSSKAARPTRAPYRTACATSCSTPSATAPSSSSKSACAPAPLSTSA